MAVVGQVISIFIALLVGIAGRQATWFGSFIKVAAYNVQAYPIVAIAPIIFILLGDGLLTRLLIAAMICYFPVLLSVIGIMAEPMMPNACSMPWRCKTLTNASSVVIFMVDTSINTSRSKII